VLISRSGQIVIDQVYPQSPATQAGLKLGDTILAVNNRSVQGMNLTDIARLIRGPQGTTVTLTIAPAGSTSTRTLTLTRKPLHVASVRWAMAPGTRLADIAIRNFSMGTTSELRAAVRQAKAAGALAMLLDLRNDPGGLLDEAISAASTFLSSGTVLEERNAQGAVQRIAVAGTPLDTTTPLVLLVNHDTASAAEIFAAALRDNHRAVIIGTQTLGTGTVLSTFRLQDGSALFLGTQEWLTPSGASLWLHGIKPDILVSLPKNDSPIFPATLAFPTMHTQLPTLADPVLVRGLDLLEQAATSSHSQ
ncbi:MAG: S41 family peptidase, partial [Chloroflexi bacterium]|nr:S41 family peptidase [Chloroflexota bacterium]